MFVENADFDTALTLASHLQPLWYSGSHRREGDAWFEWVLDLGRGCISPAIEARALADKADLEMFANAPASAEHARRALTIARRIDDRALLLRAMTACLFVLGYDYHDESALALFNEAIALARELDDQLRLCQILTRRAGIGVVKGDLAITRSTAGEGHDLAEALGAHVESRLCQVYLGWARVAQGELVEARELFSSLASDDLVMTRMDLRPGALQGLATAHAYLGEIDQARSTAKLLIETSGDVAEYFRGMGYAALSIAGLVNGDIDEAADTGLRAFTHLGIQPQMATVQRAFTSGLAALANGDVETARGYADESLAIANGWYLALALLVRCRIAIAERNWTLAESTSQQALSEIAELRSDSWLPDALEIIGHLRVEGGEWGRATHLFGAAETARRRTGMVRFAVHQGEYENLIGRVRQDLPEAEFAVAWSEGEAMTRDEAIAYALKDRPNGKRPDTGWDSLTPAELDVVTLVAEGLTNKDVATRLYLSPRTVQSHLAHVFTKLGVTTRTQLAQVATTNGVRGAG